VDDLIAFARARLDEAAAGAWSVHDVARCDALLYEEDMGAAAARTPDCDCGFPARVLREVEAKRAILDAYVHADGNSPRDRDRGRWDAMHATVRLLAAIDRDHPDYRPEWKP
jgi:uncharacterized protein DUF6221